MSSSDDPVSDFLMREQNALADLNIGLDDFADVNSSQSQPQATGLIFFSTKCKYAIAIIIYR
jgi:hypothetical protein